jgi:beta-N-acetylhexosaminidase
MKFLLLLVSFLSLHAMSIEEKILKDQIARMLVIGFDAQAIDANTTIAKQLQKYPLGGVVLFDRFYEEPTRVKNIASPAQLQELTKQLKHFAQKSLFIAIDQEGGRVARLKERDGFVSTPSAKEIALLPKNEVQKLYARQSQMLQESGITTNFAPVLDLAIEPKNHVIYELERSYGATSQEVLKSAKILIDAQKKHQIISVLKHFPGHGSSLDDSHVGFVDITQTWRKEELEPYAELIEDGYAQMIMTAHVFNAHLDTKHPATLSYNVNTMLLRDQLGFEGVIISDDLQMRALTKEYSLVDTLTLAINAGVDMLLIGNQLAYYDVEDVIQIIYEQVLLEKISYTMILQANKRIEHLLTQNSIHQKPITFTPKRIALTKEYVKEHYGMEIEDIEMTPQSIVLHWTSDLDCNASYERLKPEILLSDRKELAGAGALNVSAHFLVDRDGTIYQLMPSNWIARHTIGLNFSSIGIENVGGENNEKEDLTQAQIDANVALIYYLKELYPSITYLLGHHEYLKMQETPLWLERDKEYRTTKVDPGATFMREVRKRVEGLYLKAP